MKERLILITILAMATGLAGCSEDVDPNEPTGFIQIKGNNSPVEVQRSI